MFTTTLESFSYLPEFVELVFSPLTFESKRKTASDSFVSPRKRWRYCFHFLLGFPSATLRDICVRIEIYPSLPWFSEKGIV